MAAAKKVEVSGFVDFPSVQIKSDKASRGLEIKALIRVKAAAAEQNSDFIPIPVALVLDVQGSMRHQRAAGADPSRLDLLKMMQFIRGEFSGDVRNDGVLVVVGSIREMTIDDWICAQENQENLMAKGETDLRPVLERTIENLEQRSSSLGLGKVQGQRGFILLLSDGGCKFKCDDSEPFRKELSKYPVHAFGLGGSHDPEVLQRIVKISKGTYYCIPAVTDDDAREKFNREVLEGIAKCLGGLRTVVAMDVRVKIRVPNIKKDSKTGENVRDLKIDKIQSGGHDSRIIPNSNGREGEITVGVLYADEVKDFIVHIAFNSPNKSTRSRSSHLTAAVEYYDTSSYEKKQQPAPIEVSFLVSRTSDKSSWEADEKLKQQQGPYRLVLEQRLRLDVVEMLDKFIDEVKKKKMKMKTEEEKAAAKDLLQDSWKKLLLQKKSVDVEVLKVMGIDKAISAMASCLDLDLERGSGLGHIYSWEWSYQMQRATTTGLLLPSPPPFQTPAMEAAVLNAGKHFLEAQAPAAKEKTTSPDPDLGGASSSQSQPEPGAGTKSLRAVKLLDELDKMLLDDDTHSGTDLLSIQKQVYQAAKATNNGYGTTTASGSSGGHKTMRAGTTTALDDDDIKSKLAINLFDYIVKELRWYESRPRKPSWVSTSKADDLTWIQGQIYEAAKAAINDWRTQNQFRQRLARYPRPATTRNQQCP